MEYTTLHLAGPASQELSQEQTRSLYEVCKQVGDKRAARGKQYDLAGLLVVLVLAKLAGMTSLLGASDWVRDQAEYLRQHLKLSWKQMPCANTYKYALARLDSQQVNEQFRDWFVRKEAESRCGTEPSRLAAQADQRAVHLCTGYLVHLFEKNPIKTKEGRPNCQFFERMYQVASTGGMTASKRWWIKFATRCRLRTRTRTSLSDTAG